MQKYKTNLKCILVQVLTKKDIKNLKVSFCIHRENYYYYNYYYTSYYGYNYNYYNNIYKDIYDTDIEVNKIENFFYIDNLNYKHYCYSLNNNELFDYYINFFFDKNYNQDETLQKSLIKALLSKINRNYGIELKVEIILKILKYCLYFELEIKNINYIKIMEEKNYIIPQEYYFSSGDINKFNIAQNEKINLIKLILKLYANYNHKFLIELIISKEGKKLCRALIELIKEKQLKFNIIKFQNKENRLQFLNNLLYECQDKNEINFVLKNCKGLTNCLQFILINYDFIYEIIKKNYWFFKGNEFIYYYLTLSDPLEDENINDIYEISSKIFEKCKKNNYNLLIDYAYLFNKVLIDYYSGKSLNELYELKKIHNLLKTNNIKNIYSENFYNKIHNKGLTLIKNYKMNIEEIIDFIYSKDRYYYDKSYSQSELRDPIIFNYINITEADKNYKKNIIILKKKRIWELYENSPDNLRKKFYQSFLSQIIEIDYLQNIFDLFSIENIHMDFNILINNQLDNLKNQILYEKEENYEKIFKIFTNLLICNNKNNLGLNLNIINYNFSSKYFFYLLKDREMENIINKIKMNIFDFFLNHYNQGEGNEESLISLLLLSPNNDFTINLLNVMEDFTLKENDFYQKNENKNFILFKYFFQKCNKIIENIEINNGKYLNKSIKIKNKILNNLEKSQLKYNVIINLFDEDNSFYKKILVIYDGNEKKSKEIYNKIKNDIDKCKQKISIFEKIEDYYNTFLKKTKKDLIIIINFKLKELKQKNLEEIIELDEFSVILYDDFDLQVEIKQSEDIKYKYSLFFMSIYKEILNEYSESTEVEILNKTKINFKETMTKIIEQNETKEPFFKINNINEIMNVIKKMNNYNMKNEIDFLLKEFEHLGKRKYIEKYLLDDLINFSKKDKIKKLIQSIIYFVESCKKISKIPKSKFTENLENLYQILNSEGVTGREIKDSIKLMEQLGYNTDKETSILNFYYTFLGKEESIIFIKKIKENNLEIRNLNEFIDENGNTQLQTNDIDNLLDIYTFFHELLENKKIKNDEDFLDFFKKKFETTKNIDIKLKEYLNCYGEIIQLYKLYDENPEITIQKVYNLIENSNADIYKEENSDAFVFQITYINSKNKLTIVNLKEIEELKNKILISSTNSNLLKQNENEDTITKEKLTKEFIVLIDNIKQLTNTLNSLRKSGYPENINLKLCIIKSIAFDKNNRENNLQKIIEKYKNINKLFKKSLDKGYEEFPFIRLFYGKQFIQIYEEIKNNNIINNNKKILHLINSMSSNKIKRFIKLYKYDNKLDTIGNINEFLKTLFNANGININKIYEINRVLENSYMLPGLYRKVKISDNSELMNSILNIYINLTGNAPIVNTLLICNEETNIEKIKAFLYRAIFCDEPILFLIANMECLELSITQNIIKTLKSLYKLKNKKIKSYILFLYEKVDSGLVREIEKLIPEKNILNNYFLGEFKKSTDIFKNTEIYSSKFAGYGKTTEIKYKIKEKRGKYYYLPIGGSFTRQFILKNLENLNINLEMAKQSYIHIDLSESDNDDLMNEILFKLLILRFLDSNEKIFYLGNDINLIVEIPRGFIDFEEKYRILKLFNKKYIDKLCPLRLEENIKYIRDSPISIVAEVLDLYEKGEIQTKNIDLDMPIRKSSKECEEIINKYFKVKNQNYYQKMNFIKILSVQFIKFTNNIYFNYDLVNQDKNEALFYNEAFIRRENIIKKARISVIKNFIVLTEVFTRSPFDSVLLQQIESMKLFGKYDERKAKEDAIFSLANGKQEIFSFDKIKPSLVFFNRDGQSLSIISNNNKNEQEYKDLKDLWNSQNYYQYNLENLKIKYKNLMELIDYKNMEHEKYLEQIKILFSLDNIGIEEIKIWCEQMGNYIFVSDNFIKIVRILLNIEAKIPVILMGETGVGKTKLLEMLTLLYGKGKCNWKKLTIHAGITDQKIIDFIEDVNNDIEKNGKNDELTWIFFDELNTCNSLGLISEIMCNHTCLGKKLNDNFVFLGACNPYRIKSKKMRENGLVYYNSKEINYLNNLVYTVNPLPHSLLNFVFDFASLQPKDEIKYIGNSVQSIMYTIYYQGMISNINDKEFNQIYKEITENIYICHNFIREIYDYSSVSLRELRRFGIFFEYFIKYFKDIISSYKKMKFSLNMTIYLCYYLRLNEKVYRKKLADELNKYYNKNFLFVPKKEVERIARQMAIEKEKGISLNRALRENLFTIFTSIINTVPLIIVGKPGTSKSLSFQILYNSMKGQYSDKEFFKDKGKLYRYYYQGSETSTSEGIEQVFSKAIKAQMNNKNKNIISLVFFDEMGLAERSSNNPLKIIHYLLEKDTENSVPFLGISNWKLDASKLNRTLNLSITDYDIEDLEETAFTIAESLNNNLSVTNKEFFSILAKTYHQYLIFNQNSIKENKDFHGNRDFYNLIKNAMRELIKEKELHKEKFKINQNKILTKIGIISLERNFDGLEDSIKKIKEIFKKECGHIYDENYNLEDNTTVLDVIKKNILDTDSRYLMLISEGNDASDIIKYLLNSMKKKYNELVGSKYKADIKSGRYSEEILNKIKYIMETETILILKDLDMIYASLYDLFNQNFTTMGDKKFARIAFEYAKISSEVNNNFHAIIIVDKEKINKLKLDPPFLNRFEKHIINFRMLLKERDIKIAEKIIEYFDLITSFNKNPKLKLNLEKLLINCELHNIEGLIFKIIDEQKLNRNDQNYEINLIREVFKKIVPTFCQDIIVSLLYSNNDVKYQEMNDIVMKIYKNSKCDNFEMFFGEIKSKKNIIYTFSKITENLFNGDNSIKNSFGIFNKRTSIIEMIDSIKSENDLIFLLKSFTFKKDKNILILKFTEKDLNKINSINYVLENFEKENEEIKNKLIMFIIHRQRKSKKSEIHNNVIPDLISFLNNDYYQIFIDNLQGEKEIDIINLIANQEKLGNKFINNNNFIENNIYTILNYIRYNILNETDELNMKNCTLVIAENIINNKTIKQYLLKNIEKQGSSIKGIIEEAFTSDIIEVNDVDFFEVINTKLRYHFCSYLFKIIFYTLKENILIQILNNKNFEFLMQFEYFNNLIVDEFNKTKFNFIPKIKMDINANNLTFYNGLKLPKSKIYLDKVINYINEEINPRFTKNEYLLRKNYNKKEKIEEIKDKYYKELDRLEINVKEEINKYEFFKMIFSQNNNDIKKFILEDYLRYFIIKLSENKELDYNINNNILDLLLIIIKNKLNDNNNHHYDFQNNIEEFVKIIVFTYGYKEDIGIIFNIFITIKQYCKNTIEYILQYLDDNIIKYEISERNKEYTAIVNIPFYNIIESLIRSLLFSSIELIKMDKNKFFELFQSFISIEANIQKINRKYILFSKELYNLRTIIKIQESYKYNYEEFESNYEKITNNLLQQTILIYNNDDNNLFNLILYLNGIFEETFKDKNELYINLLFFIFRQQYKIINNDKIRIKLIENFFKQPLLLKKSKIFLSEILKDMKPELINEKNKEEILINNFINLKDNKKLVKIKDIIAIYNNINSNEFNELLLFTFENQCQAYFLSILNKYNNEYTEKACEEMLSKVSIGYLKKAIQYLYESKNNNENNLSKLYAIAYIKSYIYFYVEINYNHFDKFNFEIINELFDDESEKNKLIRNMRNIYIWRVYYNKFENFDQFKNYNFEEKKMSTFRELSNKLTNEKKEESKCVFNNIFITPKSFIYYKNISPEIDFFLSENKNDINIDLESIKQNFDFFYSILVNKMISSLYSNDKQFYILRLKMIYNLTFNKINFDNEGKILYEYIMNNELLENSIMKKISEQPLNQEEFEILLYSFRFIINSQTNQNKSFYKFLLKKNAFEYINNHFIPGAFPIINEFVKSYNDLEEKFKNKQRMGYYICKDCGFLYEVPPCTYPTSQGKCPNGHIIGGLNHFCSKMDIRVFSNINELNQYKNAEEAKYFVSKTIEDFKKEYVDIFMDQRTKGIMRNYRGNDFEKKISIRNLNIITYRLLNFILYSFLLGSYILNNLNDNEMKEFLIENLFPHTLFGIIKRGWELLNISVKEIGIENAQIFINMIFDKIVEMINKLEFVDTQEQLDNFENSVNNYILEIISNKNNIELLNQEYHKMKEELLNLNPQSIEEIIKSNYDPMLYSQNIFPDIQYYCFSTIQNLDSFIFKFNSLSENKKKYSLINLLINKDSEIIKNAINVKHLININKFSNLLLDIYSFKISREEAKLKTLKNELENIIEYYNEINNTRIENENKFIENYIEPFIYAWNKIKHKSVQYKCKILRDLTKGEKPLEMKIETPLCYFLVDDGDKDGGMFLASAYEHLIEWQNQFIDEIISANKMNGILNSYISQIEQEIDIQEAMKEDVINIDENIYKILNDLIYTSSTRNIFSEDENKINYKNYNDIIYNYEFIEKELGRIILPGLKKFKKEKIKFITYLYEGLRGGKSTILVDYNNKYIQRNLSEEEKTYLNDLLKIHNNSKFYNDIFASLQILMNEIIRENYGQNHLIYQIIEKLPKYIILNKELCDLFRNHYINDEDKESFTINSLVSIFEYFEYLCWNEIKKNILPDYQLELDEEIKKYILNYFDMVKDEQKLININNFIDALRKLISRSLAGSRQDIDIKPDIELKLYIAREDLWNKDIINNISFDEEIDKIFKNKILIGHCWNLLQILEEDLNKYKKDSQKQKNQQKISSLENNEYEINTNSKQSIINNNRILNNEDKEENKNDIEEDSDEGSRNNDDNYDDIY